VRRVLLLVLLVLLALTWWARRTPPPQAPTAAAGGERVDWFVEDFRITTFDAQGRPTRRISGDRMAHYLPSGVTRLRAPHLTLEARTGPRWTIRAESGILSADNRRLRLPGEVEIERHAPDEPPLAIHTRDLLVKPEAEYAETSQAVKVTRGADWLSAVGMEAWLHPPMRIRFLSRTRAHHAVP